MSDPVTNHDIEDVLSSIRRLVAQGDSRRSEEASAAPTPFHKTKAAPAELDEAPEKEALSVEEAPVERLVLTPAFRISPQADAPKGPTLEEVSEAPMVEDVPQPTEPVATIDAALRKPESDVIPTEDERPIPAPGQSPSERASLEATIAELEAAVNSRSDDWEPDGSEAPRAPDFQSVFANKLDAIRPSRFLRRQTEDKDVAAEADQTETQTTEGALNDIVVDHIAGAVQEEIADAFPHLMAADEAPEQSNLHEAVLPDVSDTLETEEVEIDVAEESDQGLETAAEPLQATNGTAHAGFDDDTVVRLTPETVPPAAEVAETTPHVVSEPTPLTVVPDAPVEVDEVAAAVEAPEQEIEPVVADAPAAVADMAPEMAEPVAPEAVAVETEVAAPEVAAPTFRHAARFAEVYDPVAEATADAAEAAPDADDMYGDELAPDPDATGTAVATPTPAGQLMDPDMMRDMVSQMIREELQGEMGERITRNVRKLVRREINRVLSAQEFE